VKDQPFDNTSADASALGDATASAGVRARRKPAQRERPVYYSTQGALERWRPRSFPRQWLALITGAGVLAAVLHTLLEAQQPGTDTTLHVTEPAFSDPRIVWVEPIAASQRVRAEAASGAMASSGKAEGKTPAASAEGAVHCASQSPGKGPAMQGAIDTRRCTDEATGAQASCASLPGGGCP
jgi:hypothetical protein